MRAVITSPIQGLSKSIHSHRSAKAFIYRDLIGRNNGSQIEAIVDVKGDLDLTSFDIVAVYHGDYSGSLNLFGGLDNFDSRAIVSLSRCKPERIISLEMPMPDYCDQLLKRAKNDRNHEKIKDIDFDNWGKILNWDPEFIPSPWTKYSKEKIVIGDSHSISLYRPGWGVWQIPFRTLYGSLKGDDSDIYSLARRYLNAGSASHLEEIEFYFGNIDIRHHLCRQKDPNSATVELAERYIDRASQISKELDCRVTLVAALPIENESRVVPKSGHYKGVPFFGSWLERNSIKTLFNSTLEAGCSVKEGLTYSYPWGKISNQKGELSFGAMEKPRSVHLSRASYPYWTGEVQPTDLSNFI